ncbi:MAG: hypothetical protein ACC657_15195 [Thiohalomonadales bacterium]
MNGNIKKIICSYSGFFFLLLTVSCSTIMEPEGDAAAKPMIEKIEKYKENNGYYPESLLKLIPDYLTQYNFQAYIYKYYRARGKELEEYINKGLILKGKGDGYKLTVKFQNFTAQCTYLNGIRQSCAYIGHY